MLRNRQIEEVVAFPREGNRLRNALARNIRAAQSRSGKACMCDCSHSSAGNLPETRRAQEAAPASEVLLGTGEVAAKEPHLHLSTACEAEARGAVLAQGKFEYSVCEQSSGGIVARGQGATPDPVHPCNQLGQVATLLGEVP